MKPVVQSLWIGSDLSILEIMCINSFLQNGYDFHLYTYDKLGNIPKGTTIKDGNDILPQNEIYQYKNSSYSAFSNIFRFEMLKKIGGVWVDTDMLCVKYYNFSNDKYLFTSECDKKYIETKINAGIIKIPSDDIALKAAIKLCQEARYKIEKGEFQWGLGPSTVKYLVQEYKLDSFVKPWYFSTSCNNKHFRTLIDPSYNPNLDPRLKNYDLKYFNTWTDIPTECYFIHLWNEFWRRNNIDKTQIFPENTFIGQMQRKYLPDSILNPKNIKQATI